MRRRKLSLGKRILRSYRQIPQQLRSPHVRTRSRAQRLIVCTICIPVILVCSIYIVSSLINTRRILAENQTYQALYEPASAADRTIAPIVTATVTPTARPTEAPTPEPTATPTAAPTPTPTPEVRLSFGTAMPTQAVQEAVLDEMRFAVAMDATQKPEGEMPALTDGAAEATALPTPTPTPVSTPVPTATPTPEPSATPRATADANTLVYALPTAPPVQDSFAELLARNDETIGYLRIGEEISLPVVQRKNDNSYYLDHNFDGEESNGGTLFLDGANLLVPEDMNLIVYGHNMKDGTMFHALSQYADFDFLKTHGTVYFDTIYQDCAYVPFAVLTASMDPAGAGYVDIRQFVFEQADFDAYIGRLQELSIYDMEVDVRFGDRVLLLVTCEYTHDNGRFMVALRALREDEDEVAMNEMARYAKLKS